MLLTGFDKELFRPECNPSFTSVHLRAILHQDVSGAIPYLNTVLGASHYFSDPPEALFRVHGKLIKVGPREILVNALADDEEADKILAWLVKEINQAWENRNSITPSYTGKGRPQVFTILKHLPRTNCGECGLATCMVFAAQAAEGARDSTGCPPIDPEEAGKLDQYLGEFCLDA